MACPMVAGAAACVWAANPTFTNAQVRQRLTSTAEWMPSLTANQQGSGLVDVENAVLGTTMVQ
jgi:subtilisin family serine protease